MHVLHQIQKDKKTGFYKCEDCGQNFFVDKKGCLKEMMDIKFKQKKEKND